MSLLAKSFTIVRGTVYSAAFVGLWTWIAVSVRRFDPDLPFSLPLWLRPLGFILASAGAVLTGLCIATFLTRGRGTPAPFDPPRELVPTGPYRYVRNPMYLGATAVLAGAGLIVSSPSILALSAAFLLLMHLFVVLDEEPVLTDKFGASYESYKSSVGRWLIRAPRAGTVRKVG